MKTFAKLFALLAVFAIGFTSCGKDDDEPGRTTPKIISSGDMVETGSNYTAIYIITCDAPAKLKTVTAKYYYNNGGSSQEISIKNSDINKVTDHQWTVTVVFPQVVGAADVEKITITATTDDEGNYTATFNTPEGENPGGEDTPLSQPADFTLGRPAANDAPETAMGITWKSNVDATTAKFTGTFVILTEDSYKSIETVEKLAEVYAAGTEVAEFTAQSDANFKVIYLAVKDGSTTRLVKMESLTFKEGANRAAFSEKH